MKKRIILLLTAAALVMGMTACGSSDRSDAGYNVTTAYDAPRDNYEVESFAGSDDAAYAFEEYALDELAVPTDPVNPATGGGEIIMGEADPTAEEQKIILNMDLSLQTREFDEGVALIEQLAKDFEGFIQNSYVQGNNLYDKYGSRYANYTLRLPVGGLDTFVEELGAHFNVTSVNRYQDNITTQYYDTEARLRSLRIQEERLLEMLEQAEELQYLLEVQRELAYVQYQIESFQTNLNRMDNQVSYSTVTLHLEEVVEYDELTAMPTSFGEEIGNSFKYAGARFTRFCKDVVLTVIEALPFIAILVVVIVLVVLLLKRRSRKKKADLAARVTPIPPADEPGNDQ